MPRKLSKKQREALAMGIARVSPRGRFHRSTIKGKTVLRGQGSVKKAIAEAEEVLAHTKQKSRPHFSKQERAKMEGKRTKPLPVLEYQLGKMVRMVESRAGRAPRPGEMPLDILARRTVRLAQVVKKRGGY